MQTERECIIKRLRNCVIPKRFSSYPLKWYERLSIGQLYKLVEEIEVDGPTEEDYLSEDVIKYPYRLNPYNNDLEVFTESGKWEKVIN